MSPWFTESVPSSPPPPTHPQTISYMLGHISNNLEVFCCFSYLKQLLGGHCVYASRLLSFQALRVPIYFIIKTRTKSAKKSDHRYEFNPMGIFA